MNGKRTSEAFWPVVVLVGFLLAAPDAIRASEPESAGDALGTAHYVIKVTPTLAYLDIGATAGAAPGQSYMILREDMGFYMPVARGRVLRVFDSFSIAETYAVEAGESVAMLQRVVPINMWEAEAPRLDARIHVKQMQEKQERDKRRRSILLLGGLDFGKNVELLYVNDRLTGADEVGGGSMGLRLSKEFTPHWRLALTYRASGEPLAGDADVTQLSMELDSQFLLRGVGHAGPYVALGVGMHQLAWDSKDNLDDTAYKAGFNILGGLEIPLGGGGTSLLLEGGYQHVLDWNCIIEASNLRAQAGLGVNF